MPRITDTLLSGKEIKEKHIKLYNKLQTELHTIGCLGDNYYSRTHYGEQLSQFLKAGYALCDRVAEEIKKY